MFSCFTGVLTSLIAIQTDDPPLRSLNDLNSRDDLKLLISWKSPTHSIILRWANSNKRNMVSYEQFIKPYMVTNNINETVFQEAKYPNVALIYEDVTINKNLKKCKYSRTWR